MIAFGSGPPVLVASHERSGTHLTIDVLRRHFPDCSVQMRPLEHAHNAYLSLDRFFENAHRPISRGAAGELLGRTRGLPLKTHAEPDLHEIAPEHHGMVESLVGKAAKLYVIRNPLSVLCSYFAWMHNWRGEETGDFAHFLREPCGHYATRVERWAEHARMWTRRDDVLPVRFEDVIRDTKATLERIHLWTGYPLRLQERLLPTPVRGLRSKLIDRVTGRYESTNLAGPTMLTPKPHQVFRREDFDLLVDVGGDLMDRFEYGTTGDWVVESPELAGRLPQRGEAVLS